MTNEESEGQKLTYPLFRRPQAYCAGAASEKTSPEARGVAVASIRRPSSASHEGDETRATQVRPQQQLIDSTENKNPAERGF